MNITDALKTHRTTLLALAFAAAAAFAVAQPGPEGAGPQGGPDFAPPPIPGAPAEMPGGFEGPQNDPGGGHGLGGPGMMEVAFRFGPRELASPQAATRLKLTDDQVSKIKQLNYDSERKRIDQQADLQKVRLDIREAMGADNPDKDKILGLVDKAGKLQTELRKSEVSDLLATREILTPEQRKEARSMLEERGPRGFMRRMGGPGMGGPGMGGPGMVGPGRRGMMRGGPGQNGPQDDNNSGGGKSGVSNMLPPPAAQRGQIAQGPDADPLNAAIDGGLQPGAQPVNNPPGQNF